MELAKRYNPVLVEPELAKFWDENGIYHFNPASEQQIFSIDTPPPTVSGNLHLGHAYSYSHADFLARFWRMKGLNVLYPIGYDDNGLPTERLVEKRLGISAASVGRAKFTEACLAIGEDAETEYQALWRRLGLSVDWRYTYRTIDEFSRRTSQHSFLDLFRKELAYQKRAPTIWCPECQTAIAQAELNDLAETSEFITLAFSVDGETLPIATTRPELLPACVAVMVNPDDPRFTGLVGASALVPLFGRQVPIIADAAVDPTKGTGAVMCCTFGDTTDIDWWYTYNLPIIEIIDRNGRMINVPPALTGQTTKQARKTVIAMADENGVMLDRRSIAHTIRVHERDDTPVEYIVTNQWFVRVLDFRQQLIDAGAKIRWHPAHMGARYRDWVENLRWDWAISRQRAFGVPFPIWYCEDCNAVLLADEEQLPVDPTLVGPPRACACGSTRARPEVDVFDTWATSSLSPQIIGRWLSDPELFRRLSPMSLRPQAHEIIRTWAFYTIVKSLHHHGTLPWDDVAISGWGLAPEGMQKISKSRGGGPMSPMDMINKYSSDAVRYWAASTGLGKDSVISEEKIQSGSKLITKLWNVASFVQRLPQPANPGALPTELAPVDRWLLSRVNACVRDTTKLFTSFDYAAAKSEVESIFWRDLADNYIELAKRRLYSSDEMHHASAIYTIRYALLTVLRLLAPIIPYVTEEIHRSLFADSPTISIHSGPWPDVDAMLDDPIAEGFGEQMVAIATAVRRYKTDRQLALGTEVRRIEIVAGDEATAALFKQSINDVQSVTRALEVTVLAALSNDVEVLRTDNDPLIGILQ